MIGRNIHQYQVTEKLGEGGMGVVFKAKDTRLDRTVALKFLHPGVMASPEETDRLLNEARAAAGLNHPNICTIYEINEADGQTFIAMQLVSGTTLRDRVLSGRIEVADALRILLQVADGLAEAHRQGIVHRDMKSSNIMITPGGRAVIMDFGLARRLDQKRADDRFSSRGTSSYMSPELSRGEDIDERADIWSLGVILYEMLSGQLPFPGDYEQAIIYSILHDAPRPLSGLRQGLPADIVRIVERCLQKNPQARFQSLGELMSALRSALGRIEGAGNPWTRARLTALAAAAVLTLTAAYFTVDFLRGRQADSRDRVPIAVIDFNNDTHEPALEGLSGMLITALEQSQRLQVMTRSRMFDILKTMGEGNVTRIDESLGQRICDAAGVNALVIPTVRRFGDLYTIDLKVLDTRNHRYIFTAKQEGRGADSIPHMIDTIARGIRIDLRESADAVAHTTPVGTLTTVDLDAYHDYFQGEELLDHLEFEQARKSFQSAIERDSTFALAYYRLAYTEWWSRGQQTLARKHVAYAMNNLQRIPPKERYLVRALSTGLEEGFEAQAVILRDMRRFYPDDKEMLFGLGDAEFHAGSIDSAIVHFKAALAIDPEMERALQHLAWAYSRKGLDDQALASAQGWVNATGSIEAYEFLAGCYTRLGKPAEALDALEVARKRAPGNPVVPIRMAGILFMQRHIDRAMEQADIAEKMLRTHSNYYAMGEYWRVRAAVLYPYTGRFGDVQRVLNESRDMILSQDPPDSSSLAGIELSKLVLGYWSDQDAVKARDGLEKIRESKEMRVKGDLAHVKIVFNLLAGDTLRAREIENEAGDRISPENHALIAAMRKTLSGECEAGARLASSDMNFGTSRSAREVLRYMSARCHIAQGRADLAIPELLAVVDAPLLNPDAAPCYPAAYFQLGRAYEATGDVRRSIEAYETLLRIWKDSDPDLPMKQQAVARLRDLKKSM